MNFYKFIIARLNGKDIEKEFDYYLGLVKKGIAGFIVFGGELNTVRRGISELQKEADERLIIASDLEQGLGQQLEGGTVFPPAMAVAKAIQNSKFKIQSSKLKILRRVFKAVAIEARYAGINTIFAPVLDINTNPKNPIISTRAFGEDPESVSFFGCEMIKTFQSHGITACGKHFPGHGDTETDSHIKLPKIKKDIKALSKTELAPFRNAVKAGVKMIMMGHLNVPAIDQSGIPVSLSQKAVSYLRSKLGFKGIVITDAMNMGGIGRYSEEKAALMALAAGVNIILHPSNPDKTALYLARQENKFNLRRLDSFREKLGCVQSVSVPDFASHRRLSEKMTKMAIKVSGDFSVKKQPLLIILDDDSSDSGRVLCSALKQKYDALHCVRFKRDEALTFSKLQKHRDVITAVFSKTKAWKGAPGNWLIHSMKKLMKSSDVFISFGSPYLLDNIRDRIGDCPRFTDRAKRSRRIGTVPVVKIYAYWDSDICQKAVADLF